jgi:hypothetical protein
MRSEDVVFPSDGLFVECAVYRRSGDGFTPDAYMPTAFVSFDSFVDAVLDAIAVRDAAETPVKKPARKAVAS